MTDAKKVAAITAVRELIDRKVREGYAYQWWIDLDGPRLHAIIETALSAVEPERAAVAIGPAVSGGCV